MEGEGMELGLWAVSDGEKVKQDESRHHAKASNSVWDGKRISIFGARNEIVAFQIIVEGGLDGIGALSVSLRALRSAGGGEIRYGPPADDPTDYRQRNIQIFSAHYMDVTETSKAWWAYVAGSPAAPKDPLGLVPVQLVPENARCGAGGFPVAVPPGMNEAVWIEVYIPREAPAGRYEGVVEVSADGRVSKMPIELEVFDFALPDENSLLAMVYYEGYQPELYQGRNLDDRYHRFAHRQRIELVHSYSAESARKAAGRFNGRGFTAPMGYEGPGEGVGNRIIPASFYGPGEHYDERQSAWRHSDAWMRFIDAEFPRALTFLYMPDEPGPEQFEHIKRIAENVHSNPGPGGRLPIFVTKDYALELDGAIDIWCSWAGAYNIAKAADERSRGRRYWAYNSARPAAGCVLIDAPATDPRALMWACFKHGVDVYFFWHGVHWQHNWQKQGERKQNVWANPVTFDNIGQPNKRDQGTLMGDGVLMYPGTEKLHPEEDRGIEGPCSTVQLANLRRGLQDHLYLTMARESGLQGAVDSAMSEVVPRVFSDAGETVGFAETGDAFEKARYRLGKAIEAAGKSR
jgi:hypothetical protein